MMRSLSSAVGGLRAHQTRMDVIGNNIANVNTYGFKSSRVTFSDVYYQTLSGGSAPSNTLGGTNPTQIGYGAMVATTDVLNSQAAMSSTDRALDIYIQGDGMIATQDANGNLKYSRLGVLGFDAEGNLVDSRGNFVMGIGINATTGQPIVNADGTVDVGSLQQIKVDTEILDQLTGISIGSTGEIIGVMPGDAQFKLTGGLPPWLDDIIIDPASNMAGNVTVTLEELSSSSSGMPFSWIESVEAVANSGVTGNYNFSYNSDTGLLTAEAPDGSLLTGTYKRGGTIDMKDPSGNSVLLVTTSASTQAPQAGSGTNISGGSMSFTSVWRFTVTGTNKGGQVETDYVEYTNINNIPSSIELLGMEFKIDSSAVDRKNQYSLASINLPAGITSAYIDPNSTGMTAGNLTLEMVKEVIATSTVQTGSQHANWMSADNIRAAIKWYSEETGIEGDFTIEVDPSGSDWVIKIKDPQGTVINNAPNGDTVLGTSIPNSNVTVTLDDGSGGTRTLVLNDVTSGIGADFDPSSGWSTTLGTTKTQNTVRAKDGAGNVIGETDYTGGSSIKLGGLTLTVDENLFMPTITSTPATRTLASLRLTPVPQWAFDGKAGSASSTDGDSFTIGIIALATFPNTAALSQDGESYFVESANSGEPTFARPGANNTGTLVAGYLEMSNVEISKEFTDMIITQRGFQANSRIITVSDEMLQELVNLKR